MSGYFLPNIIITYLHLPQVGLHHSGPLSVLSETHMFHAVGQLPAKDQHSNRELEGGTHEYPPPPS